MPLSSFTEEALKNVSVNSDSHFELNETQDSANKYREFGDNTHMEPSHSNTGQLKDIALLSSGMICDLLDLTDLPDAFPSFSLIGSSKESEQLTTEIDLCWSGKFEGQ